MLPCLLSSSLSIETDVAPNLGPERRPTRKIAVLARGFQLAVVEIENSHHRLERTEQARLIEVYPPEYQSGLVLRVCARASTVRVRLTAGTMTAAS